MRFMTLYRTLVESKETALQQLFKLTFQRFIDDPKTIPRDEDVEKFHKSLEEISENSIPRQELIKDFDVKLQELFDLSTNLLNATDEDKKDVKINRDLLVKDLTELLKKF